jgi:transposase
MSRYRLLPSPAKEAVLRGHCAHARYGWNLVVEQHLPWHPGRSSAPRYLEQCRQLTAARGGHAWLAAGSQMVQQQALRDFAQATAAFFDPQNPAGRPSWRKAGRDEGFRIVAVKPAHVRRLSRKTGEVRVPKAGWARFRWSRAVPDGVKSYRVTCDRSGRWHFAFAAIPEPVPAPGNGEAVGIDRGVAVSAATRMKGMTRSAWGTAVDPGRNVRQKAGLNREILRSGWGLLVRRLEDKASRRVEKINHACTSQTCSGCGHRDPESRQNQSRFRCTACGLTVNADVNAARNIAAGHPTHLPIPLHSRGGDGAARPVNREPQLLASLAGRE